MHILDFGIGSLLAENEGESLVDTMSTANTLTSGLDCASPESIMEPTTRTAAGDQYSLGCILYYCVTGRYPFPEGSAVEKMMAHQYKQPTPIHDLVENVPPELEEVVERLMQKTPEGRYSSTEEVVEALRPLASTKPPQVAAQVKSSAGKAPGRAAGGNGAAAASPTSGSNTGNSPLRRPKPASSQGVATSPSDLRKKLTESAKPELPPEDEEEYEDPEASAEEEEEEEDGAEDGDEGEASPLLKVLVGGLILALIGLAVYYSGVIKF